MANTKFIPTATGLKPSTEVKKVGGSVPVGELLPPPPLVSKTAKWNASVEQENFQRRQQSNTLWSDAIKSSDQKHREALVEFETKAKVAGASGAEKIKAFYEASKDTNDFFAIAKTLRKEDFKPDAEWQTYVQDKENVNAILDGFGVPRSYASLASQTVSQEDG